MDDPHKWAIEIISATENFLTVQWLGLGTFTGKGPSSVPGRGTKIPQTVQSANK